MRNNEISISEIANTIIANKFFDGDSIVFLPVRSKKSNKDFSNLINDIAKKMNEDIHEELVNTEKRSSINEANLKVQVYDIQKFLKNQSESNKYELKIVLAPRLDKSAISQSLVRNGKKIILIVEEFFSTEKDLADDMKEIENLGAEVLGAVYVER